LFGPLFLNTHYRNTSMAGNKMVSGLLAVVVIAALVYFYDPTFFGLLKKVQGFEDDPDGPDGDEQLEGFEDEEENRREGFDDEPEPEPEGFNNPGALSNGTAAPGQMANPGAADENSVKKGALKQGFADLSSSEGPANFGTTGAPAGCYPRDQLTPSELLPKDKNSVWAEQNPMGPGSLKGKNFLSAGALIGVNTVGQSLRNANWQLRSEPPNPQVAVSIFNQSTIAPDTNRRPLEIN
jgi:hypothetical protein